MTSLVDFNSLAKSPQIRGKITLPPAYSSASGSSAPKSLRTLLDDESIRLLAKLGELNPEGKETIEENDPQYPALNALNQQANTLLSTVQQKAFNTYDQIKALTSYAIRYDTRDLLDYCLAQQALLDGSDLRLLFRQGNFPLVEHVIQKRTWPQLNAKYSEHSPLVYALDAPLWHDALPHRAAVIRLLLTRFIQAISLQEIDKAFQAALKEEAGDVTRLFIELCQQEGFEKMKEPIITLLVKEGDKQNPLAIIAATQDTASRDTASRAELTQLALLTAVRAGQTELAFSIIDTVKNDIPHLTNLLNSLLEDTIPAITLAITLAHATQSIKIALDYLMQLLAEQPSLKDSEAMTQLAYTIFLKIAQDTGNVEQLRSLFKIYPDVMTQAKDSDGKTALHLAAGYSHEAAVLFLSEEAPTLMLLQNATYGLLPLHFAIAKNVAHPLIQKLFIRSVQQASHDGVDLASFKTKDGDNFLMLMQVYAKSYGQHEAMKGICLGALSLQRVDWAKPCLDQMPLRVLTEMLDDLITDAARYDHQDNLALLLTVATEKAAQCDKPQKSHLLGQPSFALFTAASHNSQTALAFLLSHPDLFQGKPWSEIKTQDGKTALHLAATGGHLEAVQQLLEADSFLVTIVDKAGKSAEDLVPAGHPEIITLLRAANPQREVETPTSHRNPALAVVIQRIGALSKRPSSQDRLESSGAGPSQAPGP